MSFRSVARVKCDGCKVIESDEIEVLSDLLQVGTPAGWLRVETNRPSRDLNMLAVHHFCPACAPMVESYLRGRRVRGDA
jgi:hypothetical protein